MLLIYLSFCLSETFTDIGFVVIFGGKFAGNPWRRRMFVEERIGYSVNA